MGSSAQTYIHIFWRGEGGLDEYRENGGGQEELKKGRRTVYKIKRKREGVNKMEKDGKKC